MSSHFINTATANKETFSSLFNYYFSSFLLVRNKDKNAKQPTADVKNISDFNKLTEIADGLIVLGISNIYDLEYDTMNAVLSSWQYKGQDGQIHGPFSGLQILGWMKQGFFSVANTVQMRQVNTSRNLNHTVSVSVAEDMAKKKRKIGTDSDGGINGADSNDLINDLENSDDEEESNIASAVNSSASLVDSVVVLSNSDMECTYGPWISSDEIDFGDISDENRNTEDDTEE